MFDGAKLHWVWPLTARQPDQARPDQMFDGPKALYARLDLCTLQTRLTRFPLDALTAIDLHPSIPAVQYMSCAFVAVVRQPTSILYTI